MHRDAVRRRGLTWLAILGYGFMASGLPLGVGGSGPANPDAEKRLAAKDRSTPFPCMDKPCGCATAEQCFTGCCCNSPAETLAWAQARGLEPAVMAALERRVAAACCSTRQEASCCHEEASPMDNPGDEPMSRHTVVLKSMLACGGIVSQWVSIGGAPPPPSVMAVASAAPLVEAIALGDDVSLSHRVAPDAPPPRVA